MNLTDIKLLRRGISEKLKSESEREKLRGKQVDAFDALVSDKFTDEQISHSYFKLPTGFGKTIMFAHMADAYFSAIESAGAKRQKIIIIVPRLYLIGQTQEKLNEHVGITATEYSGQKKDADCDVVITTYDSLTRLFGIVDFNDVGLIFADEAHHMLGEKISKQLEFYNQFVPIIGFTATPEYESSRAVANILNTEIFSMNIPDAVTAGALAPIKNVLYRSSIVCDLTTVPATTNGDYDYSKIVTKISPDTLATEIARIYADGYDEQTGIEFKTLKTIINCPNAKIANMQAVKINEIMGRDVAISLHKVGINDKQFEKLQDKFIAGEYTVACQVGTMTEGFDDQSVSLCINYPMRSRVKAEQCAGRVIRINENDPNKIAFVVDTIFRATPDEKAEDILYTASRSQQVLFKDIADGNIVLYPRDFAGRNTGHDNTKGHTRVEFVDFDLITDSATLIELNRNAQQRLADEFIPLKTKDWLSAADLTKDSKFPSGHPAKINKALNDLEHDPDFEGFIKDMKTGSNIAKCLHISKKQAFADRAGFKAFPEKTKDWLSATDLKKDPDFPSGHPAKINKALNIFEHDPDFEGYIQDMKSGSKITKCIHKNKIEAFKIRAGFIDLPLKTKDWLSAIDLTKDSKFPSGYPAKINKALNDLEHDPEFEGFIKDMKASSKIAKCLHTSKKQAFADRAGFKALLEKTKDWLSAADLTKDSKFPSGTNKNINKALNDLEHDPEFEGFIKDMKTGSNIAKCLHISKKQAFADRAGFKAFPKKTKDWLSAADLRKDSKFPSGQPAKINKALNIFEHDPEFEGFIKDMKVSSQIAKCIHISKVQALKKFIEQEKGKSLHAGAKKLKSANTAHDIKKQIVPDDQNGM